MKRRLRAELMGALEHLYFEMLPDILPGIEFSEKQLKGFAETWRRSPFRKGLEDLLKELPDEQFPLLKNLVKRFPLEIQKHLQKRQPRRGFGGRTPILPDHVRQEACEQIKILKTRGFKLRNAIEEVASNYGITSAELTGIWKHKARYKS